MLDNLAIIDVETSGANAQRDRIIEVGLLLVDQGEVTKTFSQLINPQTWIPPEITEITSITAEMLEGMPEFLNLKHELFDMLEGRTFVAHNARFDYSFIKAEFKRHGMNFSASQMCSVKLSRRLFPEYRHHSLDALIERYRFAISDRHRALDDAQIIWDFLQLAQQTIEPEKLAVTLDAVTHSMTLPEHISKEEIQAIPHQPGVYIFYNREGAPIYVGKSIDLKDRVRSHFYSDLISDKEMTLKKYVHHIETIETAGELGALLKEIELIKDSKPVYNRALRQHKELYGLVAKENKDGYQMLQLTKLAVDQVPLDGSCYSLYKTKSSAKQKLDELCKEYELCPKLFGLETGGGACFSYHLGQCKGACAGKEKPLMYNARLYEAFKHRQIRPWPFKGPIAVVEENPEVERIDYIVLNQWHYLGLAKTLEDAQEIAQKEVPVFNLDEYKMLKKKLSEYKNVIDLSFSTKDER